MSRSVIRLPAQPCDCGSGLPMRDIYGDSGTFVTTGCQECHPGITLFRDNKPNLSFSDKSQLWIAAIFIAAIIAIIIVGTGRG